MLRFKKGDLIRLIDVNGADTGFVMYLDLHSPGYRPAGDKELDGGWHFSVIDSLGEIKYLSTTLWTPIPADTDSCNP